MSSIVIGGRSRLDLGLVGDVKETIRALLPALGENLILLIMPAQGCRP